ncbi:MAG: SusD/RagB family nutrient-binding outer membrane lipoprotein, partial [Alistipes finegoldii]|nr:SusD/RagB family nutrient-binding outer membrane lipoprotein [Alistipes finegoldii]
MIGHEAWADVRRTGYPRLLQVVNNLSGGMWGNVD